MRKCTSWIESFETFTDNLESAKIWRKWSGITAISAALERKVWCTTSSPLYPNIYTFLVGDAGLGKSRPINVAHDLLKEIDDFKFGATSMTRASLVDHMVEAKRVLVDPLEPPQQYNTLMIVADELSAFMNEYDTGLIAQLTKFYDCTEYSESRRGDTLRIKIPDPQLTILSGSTPSNLIHFLPEWAWEQGFTSRCFLIFSSKDEQPAIDVFDPKFKRTKPVDLSYDLDIIYRLRGEFGWTEEWKSAMIAWREKGMEPAPSHPKLKHYNSRRFAHMFKLSMISNVDRGNALKLEVLDFERAKAWMLEAEEAMPSIFEGGGKGEDNKAMEEILHFVKTSGEVTEARIVNFARTRIRFAVNIPKVIEVMEKGGMIIHSGHDRLGLKLFKAP